jgi:hypothetical protein
VNGHWGSAGKGGHWSLVISHWESGEERSLGECGEERSLVISHWSLGERGRAVIGHWSLGERGRAVIGHWGSGGKRLLFTAEYADSTYAERFLSFIINLFYSATSALSAVQKNILTFSGNILIFGNRIFK